MMTPHERASPQGTEGNWNAAVRTKRSCEAPIIRDNSGEPMNGTEPLCQRCESIMEARAQSKETAKARNWPEFPDSRCVTR